MSERKPIPWGHNWIGQTGKLQSPRLQIPQAEPLASTPRGRSNKHTLENLFHSWVLSDAVSRDAQAVIYLSESKVLCLRVGRLKLSFRLFCRLCFCAALFSIY